MDMRVLGYRKLDFKADDGSLVQGTQVFTAHLEDGVTGETISKLFVREGMALPPLPRAIQGEIAAEADVSLYQRAAHIG